MSNHKKHADIARPALGDFGRNEWAILGTHCGNIKKLAFQLCQVLSPQWKVAYVDADHKGADDEKSNGRDAQTALAHGAFFEYTDKITHHRFDLEGELGKFQYRPLFSQADLVLVNGNHFTAQRQIVVVDPKKEDSLRRKLDRLTHVDLILFAEGVTEIPQYLIDHLGENWPAGDHSPYAMLQPKLIAAFLENQLTASVPPISGLVLAGGKSMRMGTDKGLLNYHGLPQREYLMDLVEVFCENTWLSCRPEQAGELVYEFEVLPDTFLGLGPMGAILSAFRSQPDHAWLVVACDLPLLDHDTLEFLIKNRNPSAMATTFRSPVNDFPEPLVTIWEPKSYPVLLQFLAQGYSCPRKALINSPVHVLEAPNPVALKNVNTREEYEEVMAALEGR
ncbi:MAG: NTP transferase domain-containing protein [Saprospiraceae bacterium]